MIALAVLVFSVAANLLLAGLALARNSRSSTNCLFAILAVAMSGWSVVSHLSVTLDMQQLFLMRLTMFFVVLMNTAFLLLVYNFPSPIFRLNAKIKLILAYSALTLVATLSPYLFTDVIAEPSGLSPVPGPAILLFLGHALLSVVGGPVYLLIRYKKSIGVARNQLRFLAIGTLLMFTLLPLTNFIFPLVFNITALIPLSPIYTALFAGLVGYAIIKHKLLDIKLVVTRVIAYIFLLVSLAVLYTLLFFGLSAVIFGTQVTVDYVERFINIAVVLVLAFSFQPIKRFFNKITNKVFYQDAYDPQEFIDDLNKNFVANVDVEPLVKNSLEIMERNLKTEHSTLGIHETSYSATRMINSTSRSLDRNDVEKILHLSARLKQKVIVTDYLSEDYDTLNDLLKRNDITVLVRLIPTVEVEVEGIGFVALGPKRSGNPYNSQDIRILTIVANELMVAIQNALRFEEIEKFNITLQQKVDDATKKLRHTNEKLKEMDETKDEFISMASHQLRTPLTSVKGYLSMVLEGDAGEIKPMQEKLLSQAFTSSQRMVYLIADLLNVSRLRTGKFIIEAIRSNLADVVEGEVQQLKATADSRQLKLVYDKPREFPELMLDETKVRQVVMNFIDNAIYYSPNGGTITVELMDKPDSVEFTVTDSGMGVPKADQPHLFTKFYRAGNARKARPDGTGLGLFMAKKVIVEQGGAVIFKSQEGEGSTFGFTFPKARLLAPETSAAEK